MKSPKFYSTRVLLCRLLGRVLYEYITMKLSHDYWPHLHQPRSFNEKLSHRKLFKPPLNATILADKYHAREYVKQRVGGHVLNKLHFVGNDLESIPLETLPSNYVIKANNGSGDALLVQKHQRVTLEDIKQWWGQAQRLNVARMSNEPWYLQIKPLIIIEEFLVDDEYTIPPDYKFFCFNGKPVYVQVDLDRFNKHTRRFYDMSWQPQEFTLKYPIAEVICKPKGFEEMKEISQTLSAGTDFMRVDLYSINGQTRFGEITLTPGAGWEHFKPSNVDFELGKLWN